VGNYNFSGIKDPVIDAVIQKLVKSSSREELITHTKVLDRLLRAGYYQILTYGKGRTGMPIGICMNILKPCRHFR
jgi:microcin C transport system substrate-binding protein